MVAAVALYLFPALWSLWILSTWFRGLATPVDRLLMRWLYITMLMLFFFMGFWWQNEDWFQKEGADLAITIMIAPVYLPLSAAIRSYSQEWYDMTFGKLHLLSTNIMQHGFGDVVTHWIITTIAIMPQSLLILLFSQWLIRLRVGSMPKKRPKN